MAHLLSLLIVLYLGLRTGLLCVSLLLTIATKIRNATNEY